MMVRLGLAMVVGVAPALVSWWRGQGSRLPPPLSLPSPCSEKSLKWPARRSPSLSDCLESTSDDDSARSVVCHVRPKLVSSSHLHSYLWLYSSIIIIQTAKYMIYTAFNTQKCYNIFFKLNKNCVKDICLQNIVLSLYFL